MRAEQQRLRSLRPPSEGGSEQTPTNPRDLGPKQCAPVKRLKLKGGALLPDELRDRLSRAYTGRCLTIVQMDEIPRAITNWYVENGYVTSRAHLPEQDVSGGTLIVAVIEGRAEGVAISENGRKRSGADTAFPDVPGTVLNIRDVEQGLDQVNRLRSKDAKIRINPGKRDGGSIVGVDTAAARPWRLSASYDNFGIPSTGKTQAGLTLETDDILGIYDYFSLTLGHDARQVFINPDDDLRLSKNGSIYWSVPYGYWTASIYASSFEYGTPLFSPNQTFNSTGTSRALQFEIERLIHRDQESKTTLAASLGVKEVKNYTDGTLIEAASRRLTVAEFRASHARRLWDGSLSLSASVYRGLDLFGALEDPDGLPSDVPRAQFTRFRGEIDYSRPFSLLGQSLAFNTQIVAGYSPDTLYDTERMSAGGRYTVRGFESESISGDVGAYTRNELTWNLQVPSAELERVLGSAQLFAAYDAGWIRPDRLDPYERGVVQGASGGVRFSNGTLFGEVSVAKALSSPDFLDPKDRLFYFRVGATTERF